MVRRVIEMVATILWVALDVTATTYVTVSVETAVNWGNIFTLFNHDFTLVTVDLLLLSIARAVGVLVVMTKCACRTKLSRDVMRHVIQIVLVLMWMYNGGKLLALAEHQDVLANSWTILALGWTFVACVVTFIFVYFTKSEQSLSAAEVVKEALPLLSKKSTKGDTLSESHTEKNKHSDRYSSFCWLARLSVPDLVFILPGLVFLAVTVACKMLIPYYVGLVVEGLVIDKSAEAFHTSLIRLTVAAVISIVGTWMRIWLFAMYVARVTARIRTAYFASILDKDLDFFDKAETGDLVSRLMTDTAVLGESLSSNLDPYLISVFTAVGVMGLMMKISWRLSVLTLIFFPAFAAVAFFYGIATKLIGVGGQHIFAKMGEMAEENFSNIRTVRSFATEEEEKKLFDKKVQDLYYYGKAEAWTHSSMQSLTWVLRVLLRLIILAYGGHLVQRELLPGGNLLTVVLYLEQINMSIIAIVALHGGLMKGLGASQVVFAYIDRKPRHEHRGNVVKKNFRGEIEFQDVTFAYPSRPNQTVLNKLSFRVNPGEVVALVGPSGGGKSTCVSLLQNFYRPSSGHVMLDGIPVHQYTHKCLHSKMAMVGQEPVLFSRSMRDNIAYGLDPCSERDVISAAKKANAHDFISSMSDGYGTCAGEKGALLSGGQKQRVAIARALVRHPAVLILDEASSALDSQSEAKVQEALSNSRQGRTVLMIAHRLSTVEAADRVVVVDKGRVVEEGPPADLLARGGVYCALVGKQLFITEDEDVPLHRPVEAENDQDDDDDDGDDHDNEKRTMKSYSCSMDSGFSHGCYGRFSMKKSDSSSIECASFSKPLPTYGSVVPEADSTC